MRTLLLRLICAGLLALSLFSCRGVLDGAVLSAGQYLPGNAVFSDFKKGYGLICLFDLECSDCRSELEIVDSLYLLHRDSVVFLAVGRDHDSSQIASYWEEHDLSVPFADDPDREIYNKFATSVVPRNYLTSNNKIVGLWADIPIMSAESFEEALHKN